MNQINDTVVKNANALNKLWVDLDKDMKMAWDKDVGVVTGIKAINQSLAGIIMTRKGSRPFNPEFGCDLSDALFENMNPITAQNLKKDIISAIARWESDRIWTDKTSVDVYFNFDENSIDITVYYQIRDNAYDSDKIYKTNTIKLTQGMV